MDGLRGLRERETSSIHYCLVSSVIIEGDQANFYLSLTTGMEGPPYNDPLYNKNACREEKATEMLQEAVCLKRMMSLKAIGR